MYATLGLSARTIAQPLLAKQPAALLGRRLLSTQGRSWASRWQTSRPWAEAKRAFSLSPNAAVVSRPGQGEAIRRLLTAGAMIGGTAWAISAFANRETRGALSPAEREYLHSTFGYVGAGLAITGVGAYLSFTRGWTFRLMSMNPWAVMGITLAGSLVTMMGTMYTDPANVGQKHLFWAGFMMTQAVGLGSLCFVAPAVLARAGLYTAGIIGSVAYVGVTAKEDRYLYLGGPLLCGMTVVALAAVAPMVLPLGSRSLMAAEAVYMYGGLGVFSLSALFHTQSVLAHARMAQAGRIRADPCAESLGLYLDFLNIFIRLVTILSGSQQRRR